MRKDFLAKLLYFGSLDTKKYRYVVNDHGNHATIERLPLDKLDTTAALTDWEVLRTIEEEGQE